MLELKAFSLLLVCIYGVAMMTPAGSFPAPFKRVLSVQDPPLEGMRELLSWHYFLANNTNCTRISTLKWVFGIFNILNYLDRSVSFPAWTSPVSFRLRPK